MTGSRTAHARLTEPVCKNVSGKGREGNKEGKGRDRSFQDLHLQRHLSDAPALATAGAGR
jgi:hypothetical protein